MALDEEVEDCLARRVVPRVGMDELERVRVDLAVPGRLVWFLSGTGGGVDGSILMEGRALDEAMMVRAESPVYEDGATGFSGAGESCKRSKLKDSSE